MSDIIEQRIIDIIEKNREEIISFARNVFDHAELGYKEYHTADKFEKLLKKLNLHTENELAITGVKGYLNKEKKETISLALIGELDGLRIPTHAHANPETQAAHSCGHHAQLAGVIGAAIALSEESVAGSLDGQVVFFAVPAEEYGEIAFKNQLKAEGKIRYGGGKCELIRIGAFDDIDLSIAHHSTNDGILLGSGTGNGFLSQVVKYTGKAAHAGACPEDGVNALNAASLGLTALAYQRETFRDEDSVRVHPILTKGGDIVNIVPSEAVVENLIRAKTVEAIEDAYRKTTRAFKAGADALGAGYEIETMPGYLPRLVSKPYQDIVDAAKLAAPGIIAEDGSYRHGGGSSDVGDLQHLRPVLQFSTGGFHGGFHTDQFNAVDEELAYIVTAKIFALTAYRLLRNGAATAKEIKKRYVPVFTKEEYLAYMESKINKEIKEISGN